MDSAQLSPAFPSALQQFEIGAWAEGPAVFGGASSRPRAEMDDTLPTGLDGPADDLSERLDPRLHWIPSLRAVGARTDAIELFERLRGAYSERHRHHQTLQYLAECLARLVRWREAAEHPHEVALAIWFKDAVYDPLRHDNEGRSARLAFDSLTAAGVDTEVARRVRDLVVATRHDSPPATNDGKLVVDIDLSYLAAGSERHAQAERNLRREMGHVTDFIYRRRRIEALKALAARLRIYQSDLVRASLETRARANIAATIARLQSRVLNPETLFQ